MSNNKQSSVEWYIIERHIIEIQSRLGLISPIEYDAKLIKIEEQAKAMHKEEIENAFVECWKANMPDGYECKLSAKEYYNEKFGGNNEQQ